MNSIRAYPDRNTTDKNKYATSGFMRKSRDRFDFRFHLPSQIRNSHRIIALSYCLNKAFTKQVRRYKSLSLFSRRFEPYAGAGLVAYRQIAAKAAPTQETCFIRISIAPIQWSAPAAGSERSCCKKVFKPTPPNKIDAHPSALPQAKNTESPRRSARNTYNREAAQTLN